MVKNTAAFIVTPMWHEFMVYAIEKFPGDKFLPPAPDPAHESLPPVLKNNWNTDFSKGLHDILFWVKKDNPRAGPPANPYTDSQTIYWDFPIQAWAEGMAAKVILPLPLLTPQIATSSAI